MAAPAQIEWIDVGASEQLARLPVQQIRIGEVRIALTFANGQFGAVSGVCNHAGGPLGEGHLDGEFLVCPWHQWKFHRCTGHGEPGYEDDRVPQYAVRVQDGRVQLSARPISARGRKPHPAHPLERPTDRAPGPIRVAGISTTNMTAGNPRYSTSEALLACALEHAATSAGVETREIRLRDLGFRACEGYYSRSAKACTWPCSITQSDPKDELTIVYDTLVHWADVVIVATPIRWGAASSLY